ncbi:class I SAM-dependent methyltransferase [Bacillus sp. CHD6a]|uniref:class I SAM-dependent methyltransferase n=1 Tax=Bacillus sp. CHD6a TaxID=1643452 RepID=UPI0006CC1B4A|nr:class I SAM-dependent methyltransferase [Bacillus sp. CHD6a]KPB06265.1 SAM-dependent methyltransferase [Bacillus sp. CHD6a]
MLNNRGFNLWADNYDKTVQVSEDNNLYPFAGYKKILNSIFSEAMQKNNSDVLDIGFGTGVLTSKLYENGHRIDGLDFSTGMISIAKTKMPNASLIEWDILNGLPFQIRRKKYDSIISTYTLHHLTDEEKVSFIKGLIPLLKEKGKIFIGDIAFNTREDMVICREENINHWDEVEYYFVYDEFNSSLNNDCRCEFHPISHCGGIFILSRK